MKTILSLFILTLTITLHAKEYHIKSSSDLSSLQLKPGDKVIIDATEWKDQQLVFKGNGTKESPITLRSATPGKIILKGESNLLIDGTWLIVDGLNFSAGYSTKTDIIIFL